MADPAIKDFYSATAKKAFEIGYALLRLAESNGGDQFSPYLKALGLEVLWAVTTERYADAFKFLRSAEYFIRLAGSLGTVSSRNSEVIAEEVSGLKLMILGYLEEGVQKEPDIASLFSLWKQEEAEMEKMEKEKQDSAFASGNDGEIAEPLPDIQFHKPAIRQHPEHEQLEIRQSKILERIRQSGNSAETKDGCRMKDVQEWFPEVSERTLRNDLQALIERGLVDRIGQSGPATYYRAREVAVV